MILDQKRARRSKREFYTFCSDTKLYFMGRWYPHKGLHDTEGG